jgi:hypothetical protein
MKRFGLNSGYIGVDRRQTEAGIAPLQKAYLERVRGGGYNPGIPPLLDSYPGAVVAYSLRKLSSSYTGNAIRVRRQSDNTEQDIGFHTNNNLNTSALTTFCAGTNGFVTTWYDQSGNNRNATQSSAAQQPQIVTLGAIILENNLPSIRTNGSNQRMLLNALPLVGNYTISLVSALKSFGGGITNMYLGNTGRNGYLYPRETGTNLSIRHDGEVGGADFSYQQTLNQELHIVQRYGTTMAHSRNGVNVTTAELSPQGVNFTINVIFDGYNNVYYLDGSTQEIVIYNLNQSSNRPGIESNINSYYNIY